MFFRRAGSPYGRPAGIYRLAARLNVPAGGTETVGEGVGNCFLGRTNVLYYVLVEINHVFQHLSIFYDGVVVVVCKEIGHGVRVSESAALVE